MKKYSLYLALAHCLATLMIFFPLMGKESVFALSLGIVSAFFCSSPQFLIYYFLGMFDKFGNCILFTVQILLAVGTVSLYVNGFYFARPDSYAGIDFILLSGFQIIGILTYAFFVFTILAFMGFYDDEKADQ